MADHVFVRFDIFDIFSDPDPFTLTSTSRFEDISLILLLPSITQKISVTVTMILNIKNRWITTANSKQQEDFLSFVHFTFLVK